jgi:hypothetical protein
VASSKGEVVRGEKENYRGTNLASNFSSVNNADAQFDKDCTPEQ